MFRMAADDLFDLDELDEIINSIQTGRVTDCKFIGLYDPIETPKKKPNKRAKRTKGGQK